MNNKSKEKSMATAQPYIAEKQSVGLLFPTSKVGFEGFVGSVANNSTIQQTTIQQYEQRRNQTVSSAS